MTNLELEEAPILPVNRLILPNANEQRNKRLRLVVGISGTVILLVFGLQLSNVLSQQKTDMAAMEDEIQQLKHDNQDLKNSIAVQADSNKSISSELDSTKTRLESTRQDLSTVQSALIDTKKNLDSVQKNFDDTKSSIDAMNAQFEDINEQMSAWKQNYTSTLDGFAKKDAAYSNDITVILQKIQSLDIGTINDKLYELQMTLMNLEKKSISPDQAPFAEDSNIKKLEVAP